MPPRTNSRPKSIPRGAGQLPNPRGRRFEWRPYKPNDPKRFHGKGKYTPLPGKAPYGWKISSPPWPVPRNPDEWLSEGVWVYAPSDSHLHSFGWIDGRISSAISGLSIRPSDWYSIIVVKYRKGGEEYAFFSKNHDRLHFIFLMMADAESPGEIGWSHLTSEMIPYMEL